MQADQTIRLVRVFLSSPGDVADERALARRLLKDEMTYRPFLRGRIAFDIVSWDDPAAPTPMAALRTPQESVNRFGWKPSECDVVVVVLWSRIGTHLDITRCRKPSGEPYLSGTEWEFEDACTAYSPEILVYRRMEEPKVGMKDSNRADKFRQYELVEQFFEQFQNTDGSLRGGWTPYNTPSEFKERLASDIEHLVHKWISRSQVDQSVDGCSIPKSASALTAAMPVWVGSPYPGLRPFTQEEAPIFAGRGQEADALVAKLRDPTARFIAVVGASGTGKSSLVRAGLLPRLKDGAIEGSQHWRVLYFVPGAVGDNPFQALAIALYQMLPPRPEKPVDIAEIISVKSK